MKFTAAILALLLTASASSLRSQEALSDADKALFDDLRVTEEAEKTARERIGKSEKPPPPVPPDLPSTAARLLDQLAVYEASLYGITDEMIALSRKTLSGELIKLSGAAPEPAKTELIATAKNIEGLLPGMELPAPVPDSDFPGEWIFSAGDSRWHYRDGRVKTKDLSGTWRWLNQSNRVVVVDYTNNEYVDVLRMKPGKTPTLECFNHRGDRWTLSRGKPDPGKPPLPADANKLIAAARGYESQTRATSLKQARERRERVAAWLVEKAKTDAPAAAKIMLENAVKLRSGAADAAKGNNNTRRNPDTFRGKVFRDTKRRNWEFLPNGAVKSNGLSWGIWDWAKSGNDPCLIMCSGGPGKAENTMLVRPSATTAGKLYFIGFDDKFEATLKP